MKQLLIVAFAIVLGLNVQAQRHGGATFVYSAPRVIMPYYNPYFLPFGYGYYQPVYVNNTKPTKLASKIQSIQNDYADKITSVRSDKDLSGKQRREKVKAFKHERNQLIYETKKNYYKS